MQQIARPHTLRMMRAVRAAMSAPDDGSRDAEEEDAADDHLGGWKLGRHGLNRLSEFTWMLQVREPGAPAYCRLTLPERSKPAICRRSGLGEFRVAHEIPGLMG